MRLLTAHQRIKSNNLQDALQREEAGEDDVQVFQHQLVSDWGVVELKTKTQSEHRK